MKACVENLIIIHVFLITETLLLDKLLIDFEKAKNKISGVKIIGDNFLSHELILDRFY